MRAFLLVSFILFSLLCLSGCVSQTALMPTLPVTQAPTQTALSASQPTGTPTTTLIPSYAPSLPPPLLPTELASATPTPQLQVLDYPSYGLRLALPAGYHWAKQAVTGDLLLSVEIKQGSDSTSGYYLPPIGLRVFTKAAGVRLVDWFYGKQGDCGEYGKPPPAGAYFIAPMINNRMDFQGLPALRYESGCWPVPNEILIDRGQLVVDLYYLLDYPHDLQADFDQILSSLVFSEPAVKIAETPMPTPTTNVCLDAKAAPLAVTTRRTPLEVRFISDGNIWVWEEGRTAQQISDTGDAMHFSYSPDGEVIVFQRRVWVDSWGDYKIELWAINRDGTGLRVLVSVEQFDAFLPEHEDFWMANLPTDYRWLPNTHRLSFGVGAYINAIGGGFATEGYWIIDVDTLTLEKWNNPDWIHPNEPKKITSPDGKVITLIYPTSISLLNADGSLIRKDALSYPADPWCYEGPCGNTPSAFWTPDSRFLRVLVWGKDNLEERFSTWEIPADGSPAQELHAFEGIYYDIYLSPDQEYLAYMRRSQPMSNNYELHLAKFDGSQDVLYTAGIYLQFQDWSPDSYHFVFGQVNLSQSFLGSLCSGAAPLVDLSESPASRITWVDADRFLFVSGEDGQPRELRLGQVGGASILIGPFNGAPDYDTAYYEIKPDE